MSNVSDPVQSAARTSALTVVSGHATPQELAAVVVVLGAVRARRNRGRSPAAAPGSQWAARSRLLRPPVAPGPGAWRVSALPR